MNSLALLLAQVPAEAPASWWSIEKGGTAGLIIALLVALGVVWKCYQDEIKHSKERDAKSLVLATELMGVLKNMQENDSRTGSEIKNELKNGFERTYSAIADLKHTSRGRATGVA